jgi:hypothetical protein
MRVQRAPLAADQPPRPPAARGWCRADVELDLTRLAELTRPRLVARLAVLLVAACRAEGLLDDASPLLLVRPADGGLAGVRVERAAGRSAEAIAAAYDALRSPVPPGSPWGLTIVDLDAVPARVSGDWGLGGAAVATLGAAVAAVVPVAQSDGPGFALAHRRLVPLGLAVPEGPGGAARALRIVQKMARPLDR